MIYLLLIFNVLIAPPKHANHSAAAEITQPILSIIPDHNRKMRHWDAAQIISAIDVLNAKIALIINPWLTSYSQRVSRAPNLPLQGDEPIIASVHFALEKYCKYYNDVDLIEGYRIMVLHQYQIFIFSELITHVGMLINYRLYLQNENIPQMNLSDAFLVAIKQNYEALINARRTFGSIMMNYETASGQSDQTYIKESTYYLDEICKEGIWLEIIMELLNNKPHEFNVFIHTLNHHMFINACDCSMFLLGQLIQHTNAGYRIWMPTKKYPIIELSSALWYFLNIYFKLLHDEYQAQSTPIPDCIQHKYQEAFTFFHPYITKGAQQTSQRQLPYNR